MASQRLWASPALCGCELRITAEWASDPINGKMYQHPASSPGVDRQGKSRNTITQIEIVSQCTAHVGWDQALLWTVTLGGYLDILAAPSPAEYLYINHWRFTALKRHLSVCTCEPFVLHDAETQVAAVYQHPQTYRCPHHQDDDDQHSRVFEEEARKAIVEAEFDKLPGVFVPLSVEEKTLLTKLVAATLDGSMADSATSIPDHVRVKPFVWTFDNARVLTVDTSKLTAQDSADLFAALKTIPDLGAVKLS